MPEQLLCGSPRMGRLYTRWAGSGCGTALHVAELLAAQKHQNGRKPEIKAGLGLCDQSHQALNCQYHRQQQNLQTSLSDTGGQTTQSTKDCRRFRGYILMQTTSGSQRKTAVESQGGSPCVAYGSYPLDLIPSWLPPPRGILPKAK